MYIVKVDEENSAVRIMISPEEAAIVLKAIHEFCEREGESKNYFSSYTKLKNRAEKQGEVFEMGQYECFNIADALLDLMDEEENNRQAEILRRQFCAIWENIVPDQTPAQIPEKCLN